MIIGTVRNPNTNGQIQIQGWEQGFDRSDGVPQVTLSINGGEHFVMDTAMALELSAVLRATASTLYQNNKRSKEK